MTFERAQKLAHNLLSDYPAAPPVFLSDRPAATRPLGILAPRSWSEAGGDVAWWMQTECLLEPGSDPEVVGRVRFTQAQSRVVEMATSDGFVPVSGLLDANRELASFEAGLEREVGFVLTLPRSGMSRGFIEIQVPFSFHEGRDIEPAGPSQQSGRVVRERAALEGLVHVAVEPIPGGPLKLHVRVENLTSSVPAGASREEAMKASLLGTHTFLAVTGGAFVSMAAPPESARAAAASCQNVRTWPVLVREDGEQNVVFASPLELPDHPELDPPLR